MAVDAEPKLRITVLYMQSQAIHGKVAILGQCYPMPGPSDHPSSRFGGLGTSLPRFVLCSPWLTKQFALFLLFIARFIEKYPSFQFPYRVTQSPTLNSDGTTPFLKGVIFLTVKTFEPVSIFTFETKLNR